jgi:hypothetical protein
MEHCLVYVDDVIIWSKDFESHLQHLDLVFQRLRMANLTLRPNKCEFAKQDILYLGHFISREGIKVDPSKIETVKSFPTPQNQYDVIKGLLKLGYPNTGAVIKACFNVLKAFSQSLVHLKLISG